jgi:hypothetical protein
MTGRRWTPEEDRQLREMMAEGLDATQIATLLGRGRRTEVYSRVQRLARKARSREMARPAMLENGLLPV